MSLPILNISKMFSTRGDKDKPSLVLGLIETSHYVIGSP
jgi:hypothetical protein